MKEKVNCKFIHVFVFCFLAMSISIFSGNVKASTKNNTLSKKNVQVEVGEKVILKVQHASAKVVWNIEDKKRIKVKKICGNKRQKIILVAQKNGKCIVTAKVAGKKLSCNIVINKKKKQEQKLQEQDISFIAKIDTVDKRHIFYSLQNNSSQDITIGADFKLERNNNGIWEQVPFKKQVKFEALAQIISPGNVKEETLFLEDYFGDLEEGQYRIEKSIYSKTNNLTVTAVFSLSSLDDSNVTVTLDDVSEDNKIINFTVKNSGVQDVILDSKISLEKLTDNHWTTIDIKNGMAFPAIAEVVPGASERKLFFMLKNYYDDLAIGKYRILMYFSDNGTNYIKVLNFELE